MAGKSATKQGKTAQKQGREARLTPKQAAFAAEYLKDFNARQAAERAGYSPKSARVEGPRLLSHPAVAALIAPKREEAVIERAEAINRMVLTAERTRLEIARIAYFDPRKMFGKDGRPLSITELDDDTAAVIAGLDVSEERDPEGNVIGYVKKWKLADKNAALEKAAKIQGLYEADNAQTRPTGRPLADFTTEELRAALRGEG
jgi:phage terminase small subunit